MAKRPPALAALYAQFERTSAPQVLREIGAVGGVHAAWWLYARALRGEQADVAQEQLAAVVARIPAVAVASIRSWDEAFAWHVFGSADWRAGHRALVERAALPHGWAICAMSTCDRSGLLREAGLRLLDTADDERAIPFIVARTADSVPQVRAVAERMFAARLQPSFARGLVRSLELSELLAQGRVRADREQPERIRSVLRDPASHAALVEATRSPDVALRRLALSLCGDDATARALQDQDAGIRLWAIRQAPAELAVQALSDAAGTNRAVALERAAGSVPAATLEAALLDPSGAVRRVALRFVSPEVALARYRAVVESARGESLSAAAAALGQLGIEDDAALLVFLLEGHPARVRETALKSMARLTNAMDAALDLLRDPSRRVRRAAADIVRARISEAIARRVWSIVVGEPSRAPEALIALSGLPLPERLEHLLRASSLPHLDAPVARMLAQWVKAARRGFPALSADRARSLNALLATATVPLDLREKIAFALR